MIMIKIIMGELIAAMRMGTQTFGLFQEIISLTMKVVLTIGGATITAVK